MNPSHPEPRRTSRSWAVFGVFFAALLTAALFGSTGTAQVYVPTADLEHPKIRYADSLISMNDRCPVRTGKLSPGYKPVYINGQPIGFC